MFETSLVESSGSLKANSGRYMWITGVMNVALVAGAVVVPLLYPEALPKASLRATLTAPPPSTSAAPPQPKAVVRSMRVAATLEPFTAPAHIPTRIDTTRGSTEPPLPRTAVVGMAAMATNGLSPMSAIGIGAPVLVVKENTTKRAAPTHISSGVIAGNKLSGSSPLYPAIAKAAHVSGSVVLHAIISKTGTVQSLSVVSGPEMLRANAVTAVQEWRYKPYLLNGEPTDVDSTITVNFSFGG